VRIAHWTWALGIFILIGSGWKIYNQEPLFGFTFPEWLTIGLGASEEASERLHNDDGTASALLWHFFAMWLLFLSVTVYVVHSALSGHFRRAFTPIWPSQVIGDITDFLRGKLSHDLGVRNAVQKLLYTFAVACMILMVWSGLVLWKPVQLEELGVPLGEYEGARYVHFLGMTGIVLFIIVHLSLTLLVPKVLPPMITGRARRSDVAPAALAEADSSAPQGEHA
jgi:thiosulfate reductase cytochrome b subunit